jgi:hypothetical protein
LDLYHRDRPTFTRWVIENGLLHEPFVVINVGVQGGRHPRWDLFGEQVRVYGSMPSTKQAIASSKRGRGPTAPPAVARA